MSKSPLNVPAPESANRLLQLEMLVTHLSHDLDTLNRMVIDQQKQLDVLNRLVTRLDDRLTRIAEEEEPRDPATERPPHY